MWKMDENINNVKMIKTDSKTINILSKIKGWHLIRGDNFSYTDIVRTLIFKDAKKKGLIDNNGNANYQAPESGGERNPQGGNEHEQMAERTPTQPNTTGLDNAQGKSHRADEKRVEDPKGKVESRGGEDDPTS